MTGSDPTDRRSDFPLVESTADWSQFLDRLINWAVEEGDAAVDQIHAYLRERAAEPGAAGYRQRPASLRGGEQPASAPRRQPRAPHGCIPRPPSAQRPFRQRRMPG